MPELTDAELAEYVSASRTEEDKKRAAILLRDRARNWYESRYPYREERRNSRNEFAGNQYEYTVTNDDGQSVTAKDFIESQGRITIALNVVANIVRNLHGQFLNNKSERNVFAVNGDFEDEVKALNFARNAMRRRNDSHIIEADNIVEHLISGASAFKSSTEWDFKRNRHEVTDGIVPQTRLFYNLDIKDRRATGLNIVGELHDISMHEGIAQFARNQGDAERIKSLLRRGREAYANSGLDVFGHSAVDAVNFYEPWDPSLERLIEIWYKGYDWVRFGYDPLFVHSDGYEEIKLSDRKIARIQNQRRKDGLPLLELDEKRYEPMWRWMIMTPEADILADGDSPYYHGEHPYTLGHSTWLDGETWGMVKDITDPQRWLNRLISQIDHSINVSGKGALGLDETTLETSTMSEQEILDNYSRADGIVKLRLGNKTFDQVLKQLPHGQLNAGVFELIPMLAGFVDRISGVNDASQGMSAKAGTPASLYERQVMQSNINSLSALTTYLETLHQKDRKEVQLIQQTHSEPRVYSELQGRKQLTVEYDPSRVVDVDAEIAIGDINDTVTQRQQGEELFHQLAANGVLPMPVYLSLISHPRAKEALEMIQQMAQQEDADARTPSPEGAEGLALINEMAA